MKPLKCILFLLVIVYISSIPKNKDYYDSDGCSWTIPLSFDNAQRKNANIEITQKIPNQPDTSVSHSATRQTTFIAGAQIFVYVRVMCATLFGKQSQCKSVKACTFRLTADYLKMVNTTPELIKDGYLFELKVDPNYFSTTEIDTKKLSANTKEYKLKLFYKPTFSDVIALPEVKYNIAGEVQANSRLNCSMGEGSTRGISPTLYAGSNISCTIECVGYTGGSMRTALTPVLCSPLQFQRPVITKMSGSGGEKEIVEEGEEYGRFTTGWMSNIDGEEMKSKGRNSLFIIFKVGTINENVKLCFSTRMADIGGIGREGSFILDVGMNCFDISNYDYVKAGIQWLEILAVLAVVCGVVGYYMLNK